MYYNPERTKCDIVIPEEIIKNDKVKNILPVYLALYVLDNPVRDDRFWTNISVKRLREITGIYKGIGARAAQNTEICNIVKTLEESGYIVTSGFGTSKANEEFMYRLTDTIVNKDDACDADIEYTGCKVQKTNRRFVIIEVDEYFKLTKAIEQCEELSHRQVDTALRMYCCMRLYMNMWQSTYKDKYQAWVGRVNTVREWLNLSNRTQSRVFNLLQDMGALFVTYGALGKCENDYRQRSDTIAVFLFMNRKYAETTLTGFVQTRIREKKGQENDQWYVPGMRLARKDAEESESDKNASAVLYGTNVTIETGGGRKSSCLDNEKYA